jgi:hypothetical protein
MKLCRFVVTASMELILLQIDTMSIYSNDCAFGYPGAGWITSARLPPGTWPASWVPSTYVDPSPLRYAAYSYTPNGKALSTTDAGGTTTNYDFMSITATMPRIAKSPGLLTRGGYTYGYNLVGEPSATDKLAFGSTPGHSTLVGYDAEPIPGGRQQESNRVWKGLFA